MSRKATDWLASLDPSLVKAGAFRVLFHLCNHHNDERRPDRACFPTQGTLTKETGLSNGGLNNALNALETACVLRRVRGTLPDTSERRTYYILGCDQDPNSSPLEAAIELTPVSNSSPLEAAIELTPVLRVANSSFEGSKLQPTGDQPVKEPVKEPVITNIKRARQFPEDWTPNEKAINFCLSKGYDLTQVGQMQEDCVNHHRGKGNVFKDHNAAFRMWASNQIKFHGSAEQQRMSAHDQQNYKNKNRPGLGEDSTLDAIVNAATAF